MSYDGSRAQYYRSRALQVRAIAASFKDKTLKAQVEAIAEQYEALALEEELGVLGR